MYVGDMINLVIRYVMPDKEEIISQNLQTHLLCASLEMWSKEIVDSNSTSEESCSSRIDAPTRVKLVMYENDKRRIVVEPGMGATARRRPVETSFSPSAGATSSGARPLVRPQQAR